MKSMTAEPAIEKMKTKLKLRNAKGIRSRIGYLTDYGFQAYVVCLVLTAAV